MTLSEARKLAVDEAASEISLGVTFDDSGDNTDYAAVAAAAVEAYERAMADAGWRMVRVPDEIERLDVDAEGLSDVLREGRRLHNLQARAWNACRAAMLGDDDG